MNLPGQDFPINQVKLGGWESPPEAQGAWLVISNSVGVRKIGLDDLGGEGASNFCTNTHEH